MAKTKHSRVMSSRIGTSGIQAYVPELKCLWVQLLQQFAPHPLPNLPNINNQSKDQSGNQNKNEANKQTHKQKDCWFYPTPKKVKYQITSL